MSFNAIRKNEILAKISEFTVLFEFRWVCVLYELHIITCAWSFNMIKIINVRKEARSRIDKLKYHI